MQEGTKSHVKIARNMGKFVEQNDGVIMLKVGGKIFSNLNIF